MDEDMYFSVTLADIPVSLLDRVIPLSKGREAYALFERSEQFGKIVLTP